MKYKILKDFCPEYGKTLNAGDSIRDIKNANYLIISGYIRPLEDGEYDKNEINSNGPVHGPRDRPGYDGPGSANTGKNSKKSRGMGPDNSHERYKSEGSEEAGETGGGNK